MRMPAVLDNTVYILNEYIRESVPFHMDLIRGDNLSAFTRLRCVTPSLILLQMLNRKGLTQWAETEDFLNRMKDLNITDKGFFTARRKFNPEAVHVMSNEFIANIYDNYDESIQKFNDLVVLATDGSKITIPGTKQNEELFGRQKGNSKDNTQPVMALISTLHDCLNNLKLDVIVGPVNDSEHRMASLHVKYYCANYSQKALFIYDRGYVSIRLMDQIIEEKQYFLMRARSVDFRKYFEQIEIGEDRTFDVTYDTASSNMHRDDKAFRQHLLSTVFRLRFAKLVIGADEEGNDIVEYLITNLPEEQYTSEQLKELYWCRWNTETSYNRLKNRMKLEEFSGYSPELILQDIYADAWMYNIVALKLIEAEEKKPLEERDGEYSVRRNFNKTIGTLKMYLLKSLLASDEERTALMKKIDDNISAAVCWVKKENRQFERKHPVNKSAMSYRKTY